MAGSWSGELRLSGGPEQAQTFTAPGGQAAILVYASKVGHPEAGCPGGDNPLCSMPDQDNEQYHVYLDGSAVAYAPDHGNHAWATLGDVDLGVLSGGTHTLTFRHEGPAGAFPASSVGYKAGVCNAN